MVLRCLSATQGEDVELLKPQRTNIRLLIKSRGIPTLLKQSIGSSWLLTHSLLLAHSLLLMHSKALLSFLWFAIFNSSLSFPLSPPSPLQPATRPPDYLQSKAAPPWNAPHHRAGRCIKHGRHDTRQCTPRSTTSRACVTGDARPFADKCTYARRHAPTYTEQAQTRSQCLSYWRVLNKSLRNGVLKT